MVPVLSEWGSIYNVRTGETFILDSNCEGKLYGFYCTETPLATLVDEGEDGIPSMKRCDVAGGGPTCKTERGPEGAAMRASRPGGVNISFPALVERAQAAALATARGATTAAGNRL